MLITEEKLTEIQPSTYSLARQGTDKLQILESVHDEYRAIILFNSLEGPPFIILLRRKCAMQAIA